MSPIGERLRSGREEKGASRVDVSQETKIAVHHLAALEYSDFKELPDVVHVKGYVRAYAEYLGLEPTAVLEEFLAEYEAQCPSRGEDPRDEVVRRMSKMLGGSQSRRSGRLLPVAAAGALVLVALIVWLGWLWLGPDGESGALATAPSRVESAPVESGESTSAESGATESTAREQEPEPQQFVVFREPETERPEPAEEAAAGPVTPAPAVTATTPEPAAPAPAGRLSVTQYGVGTGVTNRRLTGESNRFAPGSKVAFFTRVVGGRSGDTIRHVWRHEGNEIASIPLRIGSANWRTYSLKTMYAGSAGAWTVEAVDEEGNVLARSEFDCLP